MAQSSILLVLAIFIMVLTMPMIHGLAQGPKAVDKWFKTLSNKQEKMTKLHFFFHDKNGGKDPTSYTIAQSNITFTTSPSQFGRTSMLDDKLTVGPDFNSEIVGRAQGIIGVADLSEVSFMMNLNFVFTRGKYKGSSLSILGRNPVSQKYREMSIVGGSGVFRLARGIATAMTHSINTSLNDLVVEYHVVVLHY